MKATATINTSALQDALATVSRFTAGRSTALPTLGYILVEIFGRGVRLSATDLEAGARLTLDASHEGAEAVALPARTLTDLVKQLSGDQVRLTLDGQHCKAAIECGSTEANVKGLPGAEFPMMPDAPDEGGTFPVDTLDDIVRRVAIAAAADEGRLMLTGVYFDAMAHKAAAADGFRLAVLNTARLFDDDVLVPAGALSKCVRALDDTERVQVAVDEGRLSLSQGDRALVVQTLDLHFPDYEQIIPKRRDLRVLCDRDELLDAVRMCQVFAREAANTIELRVEDEPTSDGPKRSGRLIVSARSDETGGGERALGVEVEAMERVRGFEIALNARYLLDVLAALGTPRAALEFTTANSPVALRGVGDDGYIHVVMPMHLGKGDK